LRTKTENFWYKATTEIGLLVALIIIKVIRYFLFVQYYNWLERLTGPKEDQGWFANGRALDRKTTANSAACSCAVWTGAIFTDHIWSKSLNNNILYVYTQRYDEVVCRFDEQNVLSRTKDDGNNLWSNVNALPIYRTFYFLSTVVNKW
jgi:hypothetical protein